VGRDDLFALVSPPWALKNLIVERGLTLIHGDPGAGKSFLAMEWAYALANDDLPGWMGQNKSHTFKPMYMFTEGMSNLKKRTIAYERENSLITPDVIWIRDAVGLNPESTTAQLASLEKAYVDNDCDILFVDTLANTFIGNENTQEHANNYLRTLRVFQEYGPVVLVHHNKKEDQTYRGSTVFHGAVDTMISMQKSEQDVFTMKVTKQKDGDPHFKLDFKQKLHEWPAPWDKEEMTGSVAFQVVENYQPERKIGTKEALAIKFLTGVEPQTLTYVAEATGQEVSNLRKTIDRSDRLELISQEGNNPSLVALITSDEPDTL
jgi:archaellum biogenesis ATPase FlaH